MKVLKDNYNQTKQIIEEIKNDYPRKLVCEGCESELEYEESDIKNGAFGCAAVSCPCCGHNNYIDDFEHELKLTVDNVEFPTHFSYTSAETGAVDICNNEEIKKYIREAINFFRRNKDESDWGGHITGNLFIRVRRWSGDEMYEIDVSNNFYSTEIPFEEADY